MPIFGKKPQESPEAPAEPEPKQLRLFVAVELPHEVRRLLVDTIDALPRAVRGDAVRWARPEGIHLTLEFLGATPEDRLPLIHTALRLGVRDAAPFDVTPLGVGSFGGRAHLRVIWVGAGGDGGALAALAERVETALEPLGYPRERRSFNAHLTLARVRDAATPSDRARLHDVLTRFDPPLYPAFRVDQVRLMQSLLGPGGAAYRELASYSLEGERTGAA
ncbi:MAG: RNA 2',3'-cyclic phosphodiesterase [Chloroflexi bacterium]|nr:RNA 2',3'-cyclic phosphodiesterase [Chloroflexota bacterium]